LIRRTKRDDSRFQRRQSLADVAGFEPALRDFDRLTLGNSGRLFEACVDTCAALFELPHSGLSNGQRIVRRHQIGYSGLQHPEPITVVAHLDQVRGYILRLSFGRNSSLFEVGVSSGATKFTFDGLRRAARSLFRKEG
jgi:hypothetical protein